MIPIVMFLDIYYFPGILALLESMKQKSNLPDNQKMIIIETEYLSDYHRNLIKKFGYDFEFVKAWDVFGDYSSLCLDMFKKWQPVIWYIWMQKISKKILIFKYPAEKLILVDIDMLCTGDWRELADMPHLSVTLDFGKEEPYPYANNGKMFNTGVMVLKPNIEDYKAMSAIMESEPHDILKIRPSSDQVIINHYFWNNKPQEVNIIDYRWNISKRILEYDEPRFHKLMANGSRALHYVGDKPWIVHDKSCYENLEKIWWKYYGMAEERLK